MDMHVSSSLYHVSDTGLKGTEKSCEELIIPIITFFASLIISGYALSLYAQVLFTFPSSYLTGGIFIVLGGGGVVLAKPSEGGSKAIACLISLLVIGAGFAFLPLCVASCLIHPFGATALLFLGLCCGYHCILNLKNSSEVS